MSKKHKHRHSPPPARQPRPAPGDPPEQAEQPEHEETLDELVIARQRDRSERPERYLNRAPAQSRKFGSDQAKLDYLAEESD